MILALGVFARFWWITHHQQPPLRTVTGPQLQHAPIPVRPLPPGDPR